MVSVGKTTITSIAKDEAGNVGECIFTVFVDRELYLLNFLSTYSQYK